MNEKLYKIMFIGIGASGGVLGTILAGGLSIDSLMAAFVVGSLVGYGMGILSWRNRNG